MLAASLLLSTTLALSLRVSATDITPPEPLPLGGYTERKDAKGELGAEKLWARYLVIDSGGRKLVVCALDMLTIPESLVEKVQENNPDIDLFLCATHTHSAPDSQMLNSRMTFKVPGIAGFSQKWLDWYSDKISSGIQDAMAGSPVEAKGSKFALADVDANRGRREGATPIKAALQWSSEAGSTLMSVYSAHATIFEAGSLKYSGDWPGAWAAKTNAPVLVGAIGDVSPAPSGNLPEEKVNSMVEKLQSSLENSPKKVLRDQELFSEFCRREIALGDSRPHPDFAKSFGAPDALAQLLVKRFAPPKAAVTAFTIGNRAFVGVPGEPSSALARRIMNAGAKAGFESTTVVSHVNGWVGYILEADDYDRGGYEATLSFHGRELGDRLAAAAEQALIELRARRPSDSRAGN